MPAPSHLIVPAARIDDPAFDAALRGLQLPRLGALLARLGVAGELGESAESWSTPFERVLAAANGLPGDDGRIPWAAFESGTTGTPCAWVRPCRWDVGANHVVMGNPDALALDAAASDALLATMAPWFAEDGITLQRWGAVAGCWLATGEVFRGLRTASLDRVRGQLLEPWMVPSPLLRRLQNEMQMLLYTHPVSEAAEARGLPAANSFWVTGAGVLEAPPAPSDQVVVAPQLDGPARRGQAAEWAEAWHTLDAGPIADWARRAQAGEAVSLTLCGERVARRWAAGAGGGSNGLVRRISNLFGRKSAPDLISSL